MLKSKNALSQAVFCLSLLFVWAVCAAAASAAPAGQAITDGSVPQWQFFLGQLLSSPYFAAFLLMLGLAGIAIELLIPGFGFFGAVGVIAFVVYFIGGFGAGYATWLSVVLLVAGIVLLCVEAFVTPGFGLAGILGIAAIIAAVVSASPSLAYALIALVIALAAAVILIIISLKVTKTRRAWSKLILSQKLTTAEGYTSPSVELEKLLGKQGTALTVLRPAGTALIEKSRVDVVTEGEYLPAGSQITVLKIEGGRVIVGLNDD